MRINAIKQNFYQIIFIINLNKIILVKYAIIVLIKNQIISKKLL